MLAQPKAFSSPKGRRYREREATPSAWLHLKRIRVLLQRSKLRAASPRERHFELLIVRQLWRSLDQLWLFLGQKKAIIKLFNIRLALTGRARYSLYNSPTHSAVIVLARLAIYFILAGLAIATYIVGIAD
ncbi:hypothetical protein [Nostoc sp.]|uniref:hypothetical protein n=1 Tax=Nostoc sp. TaxID=1180 RepID=UPI002FF7A68A